MLIHSDAIPYINGSTHSSSLAVEFTFDASDFVLRTRHEVLQSIAAEKKVIHIGCVDHNIKQINVKLKHNQWVHKLLDDVAARCVGVDILKDCVDYIRDDLGFSETYFGDILSDDFPFFDEQDWDCFFLPEVLEHIDNPVDFLTRLRKRLVGMDACLVVSVPNAFSRVYADFSRNGQELINSDHRYVFTPYTLAKVAHAAGYDIENITMCSYGPASRRRVIRNWWLRRCPLQRDDIVMTLRPWKQEPSTVD